MILLTAVALTALAFYYVFHVPEQAAPAPEKSRVTFLQERKEVVYENLRDLNFEFKAGKFPPADYERMKASLEQEAALILAEIAELDAVRASSPEARKGQRN
ncbi:MAG: hypothetical protein JO159_11065 [Acidobacteria bacterium]|nr:hypothetical protein [Acidobacteriota bacterium]MBV9624452.1 hypothetical protein [Acidobacteriota bacterium]